MWAVEVLQFGWAQVFVGSVLALHAALLAIFLAIKMHPLGSGQQIKAAMAGAREG